MVITFGVIKMTICPPTEIVTGEVGLTIPETAVAAAMATEIITHPAQMVMATGTAGCRLSSIVTYRN